METCKRSAKTSFTKENHTFVVENAFYSSANNGSFCHRSTADCTRIVVQSEQLLIKTKQLLPYLTKCHLSPNCVIWDFSDFNYQWAVKRNISESFLLLPIMSSPRIATRLALHGDEIVAPTPLPQREYDIVMYGKEVPRRNVLKTRIKKKHPRWKVDIRVLMNASDLASAYSNSKICLTVHSGHASSGGEYHRLSESAPFGCISLMETSDDKCWLDPYTQCGGVIFAPYDDLIEAAAGILDGIHNQPEEWSQKQATALDWWNRSNTWQDGLLKQ
jgi:hypothetical protein